MTNTTPVYVGRLFAAVKASRPPGWCFGPILFSIGVIHSRNYPKKSNSVYMAASQAFTLSFPLCTIVFGMNDIYDYENDIRNPRKMASGLEGGILFPMYHSSVRLAAALSTALILLTSLCVRRPQNILATILLVFLGWQYSAPPLRLKEAPIVDSFSNGAIIFLSWFVGYSFGGGTITKAPRKGYIISLCAAGVHALAAVVDIDSDVAAAQRTIATYLGGRVAAIFGALTYAAALSIEHNSSSIFGVYLWGGLLLMVAPCLHVPLAHLVFRILVFWTVCMATIWLGSQTSKPRS